MMIACKRTRGPDLALAKSSRLYFGKLSLQRTITNIMLRGLFTIVNFYIFIHSDIGERGGQNTIFKMSIYWWNLL